MAISRVLRTCAGVTGGALMLAGVASAQTAQLDVSTRVDNKCLVTATAVSFAAYDPVKDHKTANDDGEGRVSLTCTKGAMPKVALGFGLHGGGSARKMKDDDSTSMLSYELYYTDYSTAWTSSAVTLGPSESAYTALDAVVLGRIPGGQDVPAGAYSDTIVATVNF